MFICIRAGGKNGGADLYEAVNNRTPLNHMDFPISKHSRERPGSFVTDYRHIEEAIQELRQTSDMPLAAIALVVAGKPDPARQMITYAGNLGHWIGQPVVARLTERFGVPVLLVNDAVASALAEGAYGICSAEFAGTNEYHELVWGTGVGGGSAQFVEAGTPGAFRLGSGLWLAAQNKEYGHIQISNDSAYTCQAHEEFGHLEAYCGGGNSIRNYGKAGEQMSWEELMEPLRWMIRGLKQILDAEPVPLVVFMGGVIYHQQWMLREMQRRLQAAGYDTQVRLSAFGKSADTLGGLAALQSVI